MKFIARSLLILVALYGLVFALGDFVLLRNRAPVWFAVVLAVVFIGVQYVFGPFLISWFMDIVWDDDELHLPAANREFVRDLCARRGIRAPRIGIIFSGTPNAFSFGHTPSDARVVVTQGLLDVLTPEEVNAVLAHEIGHIEHWDFAVMAIAALAPLLLYQVYAFGRSNRNTEAVAWTAYAAYLVSQFVVLLLNRTREYMADHYSAEVTGEPSVLASALVKIACGLVRAEGDYRQVLSTGTRQAKKEGRRSHRLAGSLAVMGISNVRSGASLALGGANPAEAAAVMRWELVNPWARLYELNSTHPLTALRVQALNEDAAALHQTAAYPLAHDGRIASGSFPLEVLLWAAPVVCAWVLFFGVLFGFSRHALGFNMTAHSAGILLMATGALWIVRVAYRYSGQFENATVATLLQDLEVSQMRPRAVRIEGEIIGLGVPGAFWCADLVLRDATGMLFVLYRQSIPFARLLFALMSSDILIGRRVTIEGWFRRGLRPYIEMSRLTTQATPTEASETKRAWSRQVQWAIAVLAVVAGYLLTRTAF